jgi:amino acid permease
MPTRDSVRLYNETDLQNARTRGQIVGLVQGAVGAGVALFALSMLGWIPLLILALVIGFVIYKLIRR